MVQKCVVRGCGSTWHPVTHITYHIFPKDIDRRKLWLSAVPLKTKFYESARICSLHFKKKDYDTTTKRLRLTAVPFFNESLSAEAEQSKAFRSEHPTITPIVPKTNSDCVTSEPSSVLSRTCSQTLDESMIKVTNVAVPSTTFGNIRVITYV